MSDRSVKSFGAGVVVGRLLPFFLGLAVVASVAAYPSESVLSRGGFAVLAILLAVLATAASRR